MINQQGFSPTIRIGGKQSTKATAANVTAMVKEEKKVTLSARYAKTKIRMNIIKLIKSA